MKIWLAIVGVLLCAAVIGYNIINIHPPQTGIYTHIKGLTGPVSIVRDQYGVAHITAQKSDLDAFFGLGYAHAQDRFWQMEFQRRVVQGTLSEIFGAKTIPQDKYLRTWGFYRAAQSEWGSLSPASQHIIQAYTDGINYFIQQKKYPLQIRLLHYQPKPWTVIDSISWQKMLAWDLQNAWETKLKNYIVFQKLGMTKISTIFPPYPTDGVSILSDEDLKQSGIYIADDLKSALNFNHSPQTATLDKGSNNWVVSGKLTRSHYPMLANDPHLALQAPALWYLADINGPHLHVIGATLPGTPAVVIGHNNHIAWGVTNVNPDSQDLYILSNKNPIHIIKEIIKVRGKPDIIYPVEISDEGPVISSVTDAKLIGHKIALKWTALLPHDTTVQSMLMIDYAQNWAEFKTALHYFVVPSQNFVYADTAGNIGYYMSGKLPIRQTPSSLPVLDKPENQWAAYIPFDELPHIYNPPEGYIVSANNRVADAHYRYATSFLHFDPPYRAERIVDLLHKHFPLIDTKTMEQIQLDTVSLVWRQIKPLLLLTKPLNNNSQLALSVLKNWNGNADINSEAKTIFAYWYRELSQTLTPNFIAEFIKNPDPVFIENQLNDLNKNSKHNLDSLLSQTLKSSMAKLIQDHGDNPKNWPWGKIHQAGFSELGLGGVKYIGWIWNRYIEAPGGLYTVNVGTYGDKNFQETTGASYRQIIDLGNLNNSEFIQTLGQSDDIFSKNYDDQMILWREGKYISMSNQVEPEKVLVLQP